MNEEKQHTLISKAIEIATKAHEGQKDKAGEPYIDHPIRVMDKVEMKAHKVVAVLHDVVEDTNITLDDLKKEGIPLHLVQAIDAITKREKESQGEYLKRVTRNHIASRVKKADIADNMGPERLNKLNKSEQKRLKEKYSYALEYLKAEVSSHSRYSVSKKLRLIDSAGRPSSFLIWDSENKKWFEDNDLTFGEIGNAVPIAEEDAVFIMETGRMPKKIRNRLEIEYPEPWDD